jgi:hypothetical protein
MPPPTSTSTPVALLLPRRRPKRAGAGHISEKMTRMLSAYLCGHKHFATSGGRGFLHAWGMSFSCQEILTVHGRGRLGADNCCIEEEGKEVRFVICTAG